MWNILASFPPVLTLMLRRAVKMQVAVLLYQVAMRFACLVSVVWSILWVMFWVRAQFQVQAAIGNGITLKMIRHRALCL